MMELLVPKAFKVTLVQQELKVFRGFKDYLELTELMVSKVFKVKLDYKGFKAYKA
jgi:hypothetical protein